MRRSHRNKEKQRFYLLPGQGGRLYRQKQKVFLKWSLLVGVVAALILAVLMYLVNHFSGF